MSIAVNIITVLLKSVVGNKIKNELGSELVDIVIDGVSEKSINKIMDFINGEKIKIERVLSKENMRSMNISEENIDYVVAEIENLLSKIEIGDDVISKCRYDSMNFSNYLLDEYYKSTDIYVECEKDIKKGLYAIANLLVKLIRESEEFEKELLIHISNSVDNTSIEIQKISEYMEENFSKLDKNNQVIVGILHMVIELFQRTGLSNDNQNNEVNGLILKNNKKEDYIKNWNGRLFLHQDNDKNPITLADAFIMPDYKMHKSIERIRFSNDAALDKIIETFVEYNKTSTMLITGVPGIGKTSIASWIANKYKEDNRVIVLRFRDWDIEEVDNGLLKAIYTTLGCKKRDLEYKFLVLDGYDEVKTLDIRIKLLNNFLCDIKDLENFKCIITSRPAYINKDYFDNVIELQSFDINEVEIFYRKITGNNLDDKEKIKANLDVLGIPVILYMAIISNIDISENSTKPELYNRIFAERGGIFDKFYYEGFEYDGGTQVLRDSENIKKYLDFLRDVAFQMFEKDSLLLNKKSCQIPELEFQGKFVSVLEFPIKHLFENVQLDIEFIHKSIYEYFTSDYIFISLTNMINESKEEIACALGNLLNRNKLTREILDFLRFKIVNSKLNEEFDTVNEVFQLMLRDGMTFYTGVIHKNVINCEMNIFTNMLEIMHLWENEKLKFDTSIAKYIKYTGNCEINLMNADLSNIDLSNVDLREVNLEGANLMGANLTGAMFSKKQVVFLEKNCII